ncbi:hypothetical protein GGH16_006423, partial [Coemansia sp. RSA 560]
CSAHHLPSPAAAGCQAPSSPGQTRAVCLRCRYCSLQQRQRQLICGNRARARHNSSSYFGSGHSYGGRSYRSQG